MLKQARIAAVLISGVLATSLSLTAVSQSQSQSQSQDRLSEQRYHYELAKSTLKKKDHSAFEAHYNKLGDYVLKPYIDYAIASKKLSPLSRVDVERYIKQNSGSYLGDRLHRRYLFQLGATKAWADLLFWYNPDIASQSLECQWLQARVATGDDSAFGEVAEIWTQAKSLPKTCDPLFAQWRKSEYFTDDIAWQRFLVSIKGGKRGLARYVGKMLPAKYSIYTDLIWELDARPHRISKYANYAKHTPEMQQVIAFGIQKYARHAPQKAWRHWERYEAMQIFDDALVKETKMALLNRLVKDDHLDEVRQILVNSPSVRNKNTIERMIRSLLKEQRWQDVQAAIALLPEEAKHSDRWRYWAARSTDELSGSREQTLTTYAELAQNRSFYGFLSADILGQSYTLEHEPAEHDERVLEALAKQPSLARAKELWLTGKTNEAYTEWFYGLNKLSSKELSAVGVLANRWGWYDRAIQAMIAGKHWNHIGIRFPLAFKEHVLDAADKTSLEPSLIFAIARQESAMSEAAKSSAGARGLMQLMPRTASYTAKKQGIRHRTSDLYDAQHNIKLGSLYLDELVTQYNGNRILAAAAYNAGPHRVKRWVANTGSNLAFDAWIETIPYKETRGYVQNVLTYAVIYSMRMGTPEPLITKTEAKRKL